MGNCCRKNENNQQNDVASSIQLQNQDITARRVTHRVQHIDNIDKSKWDWRSKNNCRPRTTKTALDRKAVTESKKETEPDLVILGADGSGKSTILKQFFNIYSPSLTNSKEFRKDYIDMIREQCFNGIETLHSLLRCWHSMDDKQQKSANGRLNISYLKSELLVMGFIRETLSSSKSEMFPESLLKAIVWFYQSFMAVLSEEARRAAMYSVDEHYLFALTARRLNEAVGPSQNIISSDAVNHFKALWSDPMMKSIVMDHTADNTVEDYFFYHSTPYFWDKIDKIMKSEYIPKEMDILMLSERHQPEWSPYVETQRIRTSPGQKVRLHVIHGKMGKLQSKKMVKMNGAKMLIFVASLQCYDEYFVKTYKSDRKLIINCMNREIKLFDEVLKRMESIWQNACLVLLLNKKDLFIEKIKKHPITTCSVLKDYDGPPGSVAKSIEYIRNVFVSRTSREVKTYVVNGIDKSNMKRVCRDVTNYLLLNGWPQHLEMDTSF